MLPDAVAIEGSDAFPASSRADWVSYPSQLALVSVLSERELPREGVLADRGYGYLGRAVTVQVDDVLWRDERERDVPGTFEMIVWGWIVGEDGVRREAQPSDAPRIVVRERYVMPLTYQENRIGPLGDTSVGPLDAEDIIRLAPTQRDPVLAAFANRPVAELRDAIATATPDPRAERHRNLPPAQRARVVVQERYEAEKQRQPR